MQKKQAYAILLLIFFIITTSRIYMAYQTDTFSLDSYFDIRQINEINENGNPVYNDELSQTGKSNFFMPIFHYIMAGLSKALPTQLILKIMPIIFSSISLIIVYHIVYELTKDEVSGLFSATATGLVPVIVSKTTTEVSPLSLFLPIFFFMIYCLMKLSDQKYVWLFITSLIILIFINPLSLILALGLATYLAILKIEQIKHTQAEEEIIIFSTLATLAITFFIFKDPILFHGPEVIWQNTPSQLLNQYYTNINILNDVALIGIVPFITGLFVIFRYVLRQKEKHIYLFAGFAISILILLLLKLIREENGLMLLGILFAILSGKFFHNYQEYLNKTRISKAKNLLIIAGFVALILTSSISAIEQTKQKIKDTPSNEEIKALLWIKTNTDQNAVIASNLKEGYMITAIAKRKNIIDKNFLLTPQIDKLYEDTQKIYTTPYEIEALKILNRLKVDYILYTKRTATENEQEIKYVKDKNCFELVFENKDAQIYRILCEL